jgi:hypothetical protein
VTRLLLLLLRLGCLRLLLLLFFFRCNLSLLLLWLIRSFLLLDLTGLLLVCIFLSAIVDEEEFDWITLFFVCMWIWRDFDLREYVFGMCSDFCYL